MSVLRSYAATIRSANRPIKLFMASTVVYWIGSTLVQLYLNFFLQALGLDQGWIGLINAAPQLTVVAMTFVVGSLSGKLGPWRGMLVGVLISAVGLLAISFASGPWPILAISIFIGLGSGFAYANQSPFMMLHTSESSRATIFSLQAALSTLTGFVAYLGGGMLPSLFGPALSAGGSSAPVMRAILALAAAFYGLSLIPAYLAGKVATPARPMPAPEAEAPRPEAAPRRRGLPVSNMGLVTRLLAPGMVISLGAGMTMPFMNIYVAGKFHVDFAALGQIFAWSAVATAVALMAQPVLADKYGKVKSVVLVQGASLPFLLILGYVEFFPLVVAALFVRAALMNMGNPVFTAYSMERIPEKERATFSSMSASTWSLGWAAGSWLSGTIRDAVGFTAGFNVLFAMMAVLYAASMILTWIWFVPDETEQRRRARLVNEKAGLAA